MPLSESHCFICWTELGFSNAVMRFMASVSSCRERAFHLNGLLNELHVDADATVVDSWSMSYSSQTCGGTGNLESFCWMPISASTSRAL